ncbi:MAG: glutamine synthetase family protein [Deltaproteobacteria bacterium]
MRAPRELTRKPRRLAPAEGKLAEVERELEARGIRQVKIGGFDVDGIFRGKYLSLDKFHGAAEAGFGFCDVVFGWDMGDALYDNAQVTGWHTGYPDTLARIDLSTFRVIPWEPDTAAFIVDFCAPDGSPLQVSPRQLLQRVEARARAQNARVKCGAEYEFFFFRETPTSLREKGFKNLATLSPGMFGYSWIRSSAEAPLVHAILDGLRDFGIPIEGFHTETGPGVFEAAIGYDDLLAAADKAALFKTAVKEIAARHGLIACFMAKWNADLPGCSGHLHQSIWDLQGTKNRFAGAGGAHGLAPELGHYVAGQLALMPELTALHWPTVNSYKRSVPNTWAPMTATWGLENRTCALRVINPGPKATRVEVRLSGADMNPYIAMASSVAAGLHGLTTRAKLPAPTTGSAYEQTAGAPLPRNLGEAVALLRKSKVAREWLGDAFVEHYARTREWEWRQYERAVTDWELQRYFEAV